MNAIHILKPGAFTDSGGQEVSFTFKDLRNCAAAYDVALHEAPLVIGHPAHDDPAWGWVASLRVTDAGLEAVPAQVDPTFAEMHRAGRYKKISASLYRPESPANPKPGSWYLRHVGFLGAQPPAVKGLAQVALADGAESDVFFTEIEIATPEVAEMSKEPSAETRIVELAEELSKTKTEADAVKAELEALRQQVALAEAEAEAQAASAFAEKLVEAGQIPGDGAPVIAAVWSLCGGSDVQIGDKPLQGAFEALMQTLPGKGKEAEKVDMSEFASGKRASIADSADPREAHHQRALAYVAKHGCTYAVAARATLTA